MLRRCVAIALFSAACAAAGAEPVKPIVVIEYDNTFERGTLPRQGRWLGLYCTAAGCELKRARVRIDSSTAQDVTDEKVPIDVLHIGKAPLALFHGLALRPGKVSTWFQAKQPMYDSGHYRILKRLGRWQMPWGGHALWLTSVRLPNGQGFRYHVGDGVNKQFLFRTATEGQYGGDTAPFVRWTGDLDRDGKIDILLSLPDDNCGYDERLYLSSAARAGAFVGKAAQLAGRQAACGC